MATPTLSSEVPPPEWRPEAVFDDAVDRYAASRRARIQPFVDRTYRLAASVRLHRHALGLDLVRAPVNVALVAPVLLARLAAAGASRIGVGAPERWLAGRRLFFETDLARELAFRLHADFLELPFDDGRRRFDGDALAAIILDDPRLAAGLAAVAADVAARGDDPLFRTRLAGLRRAYVEARNPWAEIVTNLMVAGTGSAVFHQLTPGALTLGPLLAAAIAQHAAIAAFPLGAGLGGLWYGAVPAAPSAGLVAGATAGVMVVAALVSAFAGVVADPLQRSLGLHQRRLERLVDGLAAALKGEGDAGLKVREHYLARLFDLLDLTRAVQRLATS